MSNLKEPFIKLKPAQCYDCMIPIRIYESEANDIEVSIEGEPISVSPLQYRLVGICPKCGRKYLVDRNKTSFAITDTLKKYLNIGGSDNNDERIRQEKCNNEFGYDTTNCRRS